MKNGWQTKRLGDVATLQRGFDLPTRNRVSGDFPLVSSSGIIDTHNEGPVKAPGVATGRSGSIGNVFYVEEDFWPLNTVLFVKDFHGNVPRFVFHLLRKFDLSRFASGAGVPTLNRNFVHDEIVSIPPLPEQRRIVGILDEAFDGIATAKANAEKNLQNARDIQQSIVSDATGGMLTADWRESQKTENASVLLEQRLAQRRANGKYKEPKSPVTNKPVEIPSSWTLASPEHVTTNIVDCPHSTPKWTKTGVICLRTTNFQPGFLDLESVQFVSQKTYNERIMRLEPTPGDVLYSREGGILGIACVMPENLRACLGQRMMLFRLDAWVCLPRYFEAVLNSSSILSEVKRLTGGAASPHLNIRDIRQFPVPLPPIKEQTEIVTRLDALSAETQRLESIYQRKLDALDELKKSLLHQAFSGEL